MERAYLLVVPVGHVSSHFKWIMSIMTKSSTERKCGFVNSEFLREYVFP
jgi:hypothetical protein